MDPISALSLACNVLQLVECSIECAKVCKEIYDNGTLDENNRVEKYTAEIIAANKDLQVFAAEHRSTSSSLRIERIAHDASATADELKIALNRLKLSKSQGVRRLGGAFKTTLRTLIASGTVRKLQQRLERQDAALRSSILKELYIKAGKADLTHSKQFQNLAQGQRDLIVQILQNQQLLSEEFTGSIRSFGANITAQLDAQDIQLDKSVQKHNVQLILLREERLNACKRHLLKALSFPEINERRNMVEGRVDDFGDTYKWILYEYSQDEISLSHSDALDTPAAHEDKEEIPITRIEAKHSIPSAAIGGIDSDQGDCNDSDSESQTNRPLANSHEETYATPGTHAGRDQGSLESGGNIISSVGLTELEVNLDQPTENLGVGLHAIGAPEALPNIERQETRPTHAFVEWLKSESGLFWISGKPGSGKSTLLNYIYQILQPERSGAQLFKKWAEPYGVIVLSFWFFRPASTPLLRTLHGFWRSLCFQILDLVPAVVKTIRENEDGTAPSSLRSCLLPDGSCAESWTDKELRDWFWYLIEHSDSHYCILLDGLDEIESSRQTLINTVLDMSARSNKLKVCCACRPENPFQNVLRHYPYLRLQDFNQNDIAKDCTRRLEGTRAEGFALQIARRAEGVFLWAHLIAEDLARAAKEGETESDLNLRLRDCPDEMTELFKYMLLKQDKLYSKRLKPYLRLVEYASSINIEASLLELLIATLPEAYAPRWSEMSGKFNIEFLSYLEQQLDGLGPRIEATCTGLVQCLAPTNNRRYWTLLESDPTFPKLNEAIETQVILIHRSVHDFLREDADGAAYYQKFDIDDDEAATMLTAGAAAPLFLSDERLGHHLRPILTHYAKSLSKDGWNTEVMTILDSFFKQVEFRCSPSSSDEEIFYPGLYVFSPDLSLYDNLAIGFCSMHVLEHYVRTKLVEADSSKRHVMAAHALCTYLCGYWNRDHGQMVALLSSYVEPLQVHRIIQSWGDAKLDPLRAVTASSTCSVIEHVVAARLFDVYRWRQFELDYSCLPPEYLDSCKGRDLSSGFVESWMLFDELNDIQCTFASPEDDCLFVREKLKQCMVAVIHMRPQDVISTVGFPFKVVRWSPYGTERFFHINEAVQQEFCRPHTEESWDNLQRSVLTAMVEDLNCSHSDMTSAEIECIKASNKDFLTMNENGRFEALPDCGFILTNDKFHTQKSYKTLINGDPRFWIAREAV